MIVHSSIEIDRHVITSVASGQGEGLRLLDAADMQFEATKAGKVLETSRSNRRNVLAFQSHFLQRTVLTCFKELFSNFVLRLRVYPFVTDSFQTAELAANNTECLVQFHVFDTKRHGFGEIVSVVVGRQESL